jgi:hypothetical protein
MKRSMLAFATVALAAASAATKYNVALFQPAVANRTELKSNGYKVEVEDNKPVSKHGMAPVRVQDTGGKNRTNTTRYFQGSKLQEIRFGGTRTKLVFEDDGSADSAAGSR